MKRMGFDNRCFAAAIVESAVHGKVRLTETEGGWLSRDKMRIDKTGDPADMPVAERGMLNALFAGGELDRDGQGQPCHFRAAQSALQKRL